MVLHIDSDLILALEPQDFVGQRVAVLGTSGFGKTNTGAVLIEELHEQGFPMTIVDVAGEYWGLKEKYQFLIAGKSSHAELLVGPENAASLAEFSMERGISIILDLSRYKREEQVEFLLLYFQRIWDLAIERRRPYEIVLEEAHRWIPQDKNTPLKELFIDIASEGRKHGLGIIMLSQRTAKIEKDVLTQAPMLFLHKVIHPIDVKTYVDLIPLPSATVKALIESIGVGQAIFLYNHIAQVVTIRRRSTFHAGATPDFNGQVQPEIQHIDATMLRELQAMMAASAATQEDHHTEARLLKRIKELEAQLAERDAQIATLLEQNALLSKLSIAVQHPETLEINHATVHAMHVAGKSPATVVESKPVRTTARAISPPAAPAVSAPPLNERKFLAFKQRLELVPLRYRRILQVLTEKDREMSVVELAAWLNVQDDTLRKKPPTELLRLGLISRVSRAGGFHYRSRLKEQLREGFPNIDVEQLVSRLFR